MIVIIVTNLCLKCDPIQYYTFQNLFDDLKMTQFEEGLIPQTLIQKFKTRLKMRIH